MTLMMRDLENQEIGLEKGRKEGRKEGRKQGRKEGRKERDREKIAEMIRDGKTPQAIADFCKYPIKLVQEVQSAVLAGN